MQDPLATISTRITPQNEKVLGRPEQVENNAGGFVFQVTPETQIRRFLILGTTGGTYYQGEKELTKQNAEIVIDWAINRTRELVDILTEISVQGRAPKQNPTIFALATACALGKEDADRSYAFSKLQAVCRTGTHLFMFVKYYEQFRGWSRKSRTAVGSWYNDKDADKLAYQVLKYRQREGWTHRDVLRVAHPKSDSIAHKALYNWITKNNLDEHVPSLVRGFLLAQSSNTVGDWVDVIRNYSISWEMLPDEALTNSIVWGALLDKGLPQGALIRQLPRLTNLGVIKSLGNYYTKLICEQLTDQERLRKARIHPVNVLIAQKTYAGGRSLRGSSEWSPVTQIVDALDEAFYLSFGNVEPANKRTVNALDVSGSMVSQISGLPISCREASGAMSMVTVRTEPDVATVGFTSNRYSRGFFSFGGPPSNTLPVNEGLTVLPLSARQRLDDVIKTISGLPFGATDCALPMVWAQREGLEVDTFIVWTDNETWSGRIQPYQALNEYRRASGIPAKLIVCGMTATNFSIADPRDSGMLDVTGFDSAVPNLIADFSAGRI